MNTSKHGLARFTPALAAVLAAAAAAATLLAAPSQPAAGHPSAANSWSGGGMQGPRR